MDSLEERLSELIESLSEEELTRLALADWTPLRDRGLPWPNYVDSGTGLRDLAGATAFPAGIALGATFDRELAEEYGAAVGAEARAAGFTVVLGPTLDPALDPLGGRIPEALGESPFLSGELGAAHVRGLQSRHVIAQLKHFLGYTHETLRTGEGLAVRRTPAYDLVVDPQNLHDFYAEPFRRAVKAGAWSLMGSYNRVNGSYVCESPDLLDLPRAFWGWEGFYCPDFIWAVRDPAVAVQAGLDVPGLDGAAGRTAEQLAAVPGSAKTFATRVVRALLGSGLVDDPLPEPGPPSTPDHLALARRVAIASSVLLHNEGLLPLPENASIALIGPSGSDALFTTGGSAAVTLTPDRLVTPLAGIRTRALGGVTAVEGFVGDLPLTVVPAGAFSTADGRPGLTVELVGEDGQVAVVSREIVDEGVAAESLTSAFPARWRGLLTSDVTGWHRLSLEVAGRAQVRLEGQVVMRGEREMVQFMHGPSVPLQAWVQLHAGVGAELEIDFEVGPALVVPPAGWLPRLRLGWQQPDGRFEEAERAAAAADVAIVLVTVASSEGADRVDLKLPGDQDELVRRVAAANPRTVVVLNAPGAVELPWRDEVGAILHVWYPGEQYGSALAAMLFGDEEPGGRLPLTFPDFPFGHGLGYAPLSYSLVGAEIREGDLVVTVELDNPGERAGQSVLQAYLEPSAGRHGGLVAFQRFSVAPGSRLRVEFQIHADDLRRFDPESGRRILQDGELRLRLGSDALRGEVLALSCRDDALVECAADFER